MKIRREPKVGWANDVVYWYSQLVEGKEVPSEMRGRVEELRQQLTSKGAARFLCGVAGGGAKCLAPLPDKRTPLPKGIAAKARAEMLPALTTLLEVLRAKQERRNRGQAKQAETKSRKGAREKKQQQKEEAKRARELAAAAKAASAEAGKTRRGKKAATKPAGEAQPTILEALESNRQPPAGRKAPANQPLEQALRGGKPPSSGKPASNTKPRKGAAGSAAPTGGMDLEALINEYAAQIDPAELAKAA